MFGKKSKILKLQPVRNCFTLAMRDKLVVIINSLKVPEIKKILLNEMKFLMLNYSCLQNLWLGGYRPKIPVFSVLNWICWHPPTPGTKIHGYTTVLRQYKVCWCIFFRLFSGRSRIWGCFEVRTTCDVRTEEAGEAGRAVDSFLGANPPAQSLCSSVAALKSESSKNIPVQGVQRGLK